MEPLFWVNCLRNFGQTWVSILPPKNIPQQSPAGKLRRLLAQCRMMVQQFSTSTTAAATSTSLSPVATPVWQELAPPRLTSRGGESNDWDLSDQTSQGNSWHQRQLPRFAYCRWFITTWNRARPSSTSPGKFGCPRSSTRTWRRPRPTNQSGQRHNSLELCWMRPRRFPWRTWNCPQNGWWRPNKYFAMPGSWLEQLTFRSSKSLTTSSAA